ncbi:MAG: hypothetical protein KBF21_19590 [Thermoanaerobaculia bacterium]|jgi:hypothetical protein|nr:hypothetical protein [Thermoanaerobaculia bacterium]
MPKRRTGRGRQEILNRSIHVRSVELSVSRRAQKRRGEFPRFEGHPWLKLHGEAEESLAETRQFLIRVNVDDSEEPGPSRPPAIGAVLRVKPEFDALISLDSASFDRVWSMATAGLVRYCWIAFTQPYRGSSLVVSVSFSSEKEE